MRRQEPSMEDILASIRRIIADDQTQGQRSGYGASEEGPPPATVEVQPEPGRATESGPDVNGPGQRSDADHDGVLDLAEMPEAAFAEPEAPFSEHVHSGYEDPHPAAVEPVLTAAGQAAEPVEDPAPLGRASARTPEVAFTEAPAPYRSRQDPASRFRIPRNEPEPVHPELVQMDYKALDMPAFRPDTPEEYPVRDEEPAEAGDALISPALGASVMSAFETLAATVVLQNDDMLERVMRELLRPLVKNWLDENLPTLVERLVRNEIERVARGGRG